MKEIRYILLLALLGLVCGWCCMSCKSKPEMKLPKVELPQPEISWKTPTTKSQGNTVQCGCDLSKPLATPDYKDVDLAAAGNAEECPTYAGRDIRLNVIRADGGYWSLGHLLPKAIAAADPVQCRCFEADGGRYHFLGYTHRDNHKENIVKAKTGDKFEYVTTTWVWYEYRKSSNN